MKTKEDTVFIGGTMTRLLTIEEFRAISGYRTKAAVYKAVERGHIPAIRIGKSIRIPEDQLIQFLRLDRVPERMDAK